MNQRSILICGAAALFVLCVALAVVSHSAAQAPEKTSPKQAFELHFSLRLDESGERKLYLDMPASENFLRTLLNGQEKHPAVFLVVTKDTSRDEIVKAIGMLDSLGLQSISLLNRHPGKP